MNLHGRNLSIQLRGDDVALLQTEMRQLGFDIKDPVGFFGSATRDAVLEYQRRVDLQPTGIVDDNTARRINEEVDALANRGRFVVRGRVRAANRDSLADVEVRAFDKDMRNLQQLGVSLVDQEGNYEITYIAEQFLRAEKKTADLVVRVFRQGEILPAASEIRFEEIHFNAAPVETINLWIGDEGSQTPSEYEQLVEELTPVLDGVPLAELTAKDVTFLAGETEQDAHRIRYLIAAAQLANQTGLPPEAFYGFARQNLPTELPALLAQHPQMQRLALQTAVRENIIPTRLGDLLDGILERLQQLRVQRALQSSGDIRSPSLGDLLNTCLPEGGQQQEFATLYLRHEGSLDDFWLVLRQSPNFRDETNVQSIQFAFGLASFTQNHLSMVKVLQQSRSGDARASLRALAKRNVRDWIGLISQVIGQDPNAFPPDIEGDTAADKAANYAEEIAAAVTSAFPTAVIAHKLEADELPHKDDLLQFFAANPDFELASMPIQRYIAQNPQTALAGVSNKDGVTRQLQSMERVFKLAPEYDHMRVLLADGLDSAYGVATMGSEAFVAGYSEKLNSEDVAIDIYNDATHIAATALALHMKYSTSMSMVSPAAAPDVIESPEITDEFPEWKSLFGTLQLCACEHCRSVLSPAAYLVDVLHLLGQCAKGPTGKTPLEMLLARRSDIQDIELSCANTNTPLPYIDLVNEILENAIFPYGGAGVWQTRATAEELSAYPEAEHFNPKVYHTLADEVVYPWTLPFDLWLEQVRLYLDHVGVQYYQVMEAYLGGSVPSDPEKSGPADKAVAAEYLHISAREWKIITQQDLKTTFQFWGYDSAPSTPDAWVENLKRVSTFLKRSGLEYAELLELLDTDFIDPSDSFHILPMDGCNFDEMTIVGLTKEALEKIHRFVRLRRKLGWTMRDLDKAITAFKPGTPTEANLTEVFLVQLSHVARLHAELNVPIVNLLAWWAPIDTSTYNTAGIPETTSLYHRLFQNRAVFNPVDPVFELGAGNPLWTFPFLSLNNYLPALQAALDISGDDLRLLTDSKIAQERLQISKSEIPDPDLSLDHVSHLYRVVSLSKALGLSIADFLSVKALTSIDPAPPSTAPSLDPFLNTASTLRFVKVVRRILESPFSIEELDYLLRHARRPLSRLGPTEGDVTQLLEGLRSDSQREELAKIDADTTFVAGPSQTLLRRALAVVMPAAQVDRAIDLIDDTSTLTADLLKSRSGLIDENFASFLNPAEAKAKLLITDPVSPSVIKDKEARFTFVLAPLLIHVNRVLKEQLIARELDTLGLNAETVPKLLNLVSPPFVPVSTNAIDVMTDIVKFSPENQTQLYTLLQKIAMLMNGFGTSADELTWMVKKGSARGWLDLNKLPLTVSDAPPQAASLPAWKALADLYDLFAWNAGLRKDRSPGANPHRVPVFDLFDKADTGDSAADLRSMLAKLTGWKLEDDTAGALVNVLPLSARLSFRDVRGLLPLKNALDMAKRLGLPPTQLRHLCDVTGPKDGAGALMRAIRSEFDNGKPLSVIRPVSDALREKQRSALVAHLVFDKKFRNSDDLFAELLIDVEMSACQLTSRIKQAMSSAQLFVQRALMGLENNVSISRANAQKWKWIQNYRVWEANRKVFLYPENWIEPNLRDDKTPFFKELENELLQDEITPENVESAFLNYLDRLDHIARPEICGIYHQQEEAIGGEDEIDILHVFGRTRDIPYIYYYRHRQNGEWTPWERVDVDIQDDHLIPVVYERRLHLFWPTFTEITEEQRFSTTATNVKEPFKYWEIRLESSTYRNEKWSAKAVSKDALALRVLKFRKKGTKEYIDKKNFLFKSEYGGGMSIVCYVRHLAVNNLLYVNYADATLKEGLVESPVTPENALGGYATGTTAVSREDSFLKQINYGPEYEWTRVGLFHTEGCHSNMVATMEWKHAEIELPRRTKAENQQFVEVDNAPPGEMSLPEKARSLPVLQQTLSRFDLLVRHQELPFDPAKPFFFEDQKRTFFVSSVPVKDPITFESKEIKPYVRWRYLFETFYHPYTCNFIKQVNRSGLDRMLDADPSHPDPEVSALARQQINDKTYFEAEYKPTEVVIESYPVADVDFTTIGAYSQYNWELFFHIPFFVADQLSKNQRFADAHQWFKYIFDPTNTDAKLAKPERYWKIRPFVENQQAKFTTAWLMQVLEYGKSDPDLVQIKADFENQVKQWMKNPFNPHLIARLRRSAYQKTVVMKFIDNLIAWGDDLFGRDTIEAINEATQLYVLAAAILGEKPKEIPARNLMSLSFRKLALKLDIFSNSAVLAIESFLPAPKPGPAEKKGIKKTVDKKSAVKEIEGFGAILDIGRTLYFCIPNNDVLLRYWDTVADRLFKIRNCMNIEGVVRQLPLFEPPIDPALLVRATAAGLDISSILTGLNAPLMGYRFTSVLRSALDFCSEVQALGSALLSAREKKDAEGVALLRSTQEIRLLEANRQIKQLQIIEVQHSLEALKKASDMAQSRQTYYNSREFENAWEKAHLALSSIAMISQTVSQGLELAASTSYVMPDFTFGVAGWAGTPVGLWHFGGSNLGAGSQAAGRAMGMVASATNAMAAMAATEGSYSRRADEWEFQANLATTELAQVEQQILGAQIRLEIARKDLLNHDLQVTNAKAVDAYMRSKFTNRELYSWMVAQLSQLFFQSYRIALDLGKRAERTFAFELGKDPADAGSFIQQTYWDNMKKGLLAGEQLRYDLKRLEVAYLEQNKREYEITKNISLAMLDPLELITLKQTGECFINLGEALFDSDYPGHYLRRIKSASLSIPCVAGPHTSVNCTLTLLSNEVRIKADTSGKYVRDRINDDFRFKDNVGAIQSIATSSAQNDSGMFELLFRDERYLPFEGAGAISTWQISLPRECNQFDFNTMSDVIIHLKYTARDGGATLRKAALAAISAKRTTEAAIRFFSAKLEFPDEWHRFLHPDDTAVKQTLELDVNKDRFPFQYRGMKLTVSAVTIFLKLKEGSGFTADNLLGFDLIIGSIAPDTQPVRLDVVVGLPKAVVPVPAVISDAKKGGGKWIIEFGEHMLYTPPPSGTPPVPGTPVDIGLAKHTSSLKKSVMVGDVEHFRLNTDVLEDLWIAIKFNASA